MANTAVAILFCIVINVIVAPLLLAFQCHECSSYRSAVSNSHTCNCLDNPDENCEIKGDALTEMANYLEELSLFRVDENGHLKRDITWENFKALNNDYDNCLAVVVKSTNPDEAAIVGRIGLLSSVPGVTQFLTNQPSEETCNFKKPTTPIKEGGLEVIEYCVCKTANCNKMNATAQEIKIKIKQAEKAPSNEKPPPSNDTAHPESVQKAFFLIIFGIGMTFI